MRAHSLLLGGSLAAAAAGSAVIAIADDNDSASRHRAFHFTPLAASAPCVPGGGGTYPNEQPFLLPPGFSQEIIAREGDGQSTDNWDMNTLNETGRQAGRFLYRTHEEVERGQVTVTDLRTRTTRVLAQRDDWNRLDGIVWTPWRTLLVGEEMRPGRTPSLPDPENPLALAGLVFEVDPTTGASVARPALGAKAHEGIRFDTHGNIYGISETAPTTRVNGVPRPGGYIFKFTPDRRGDLSTGQLFALKIVHDRGDRTGEAIWVPLDREAVRIDADAEATRVGATGYGRPEDVETGTSTGTDINAFENLYVAVTDENRILRIILAGPFARVVDYVRAGVNAPADFTNPDNLALDKAGNLFITEDTTTPPGMDIWMAARSRGSHLAARRTVRFASLTDCTSEPSGIYFDLSGRVLFVHTLHRAGADLEVAITQTSADDRDNEDEDE